MSGNISGSIPEFLFGGELSTPQRLAYGLVPLIQLLEAGGYAVEDVLGAAEIPRFALEEPSFRILLAQELAFTRLALDRVADPRASLEVGRRFHLSMFGVLGLAAACAGSLRESFQLFLSYPALVWGLIEITLWRQRDDEYIAFESGDVVAELGDYFIERDMAALLTLFRNILGPEVTPSAIKLRRRQPREASAYRSFFGCAVTFDADANEMHLDRSVWNAAPLQANEMSRRFFENQCRRLSETMQAPFRYTDIVRNRLRHATPIPSLPELAETLHLTTRTLQRRLAAENNGFTTVLREVREARARELLRQPSLHVEEIAYRLGFREADAFSRAFRSWTGRSPSDFRRGPPLA